MLIRQTFSGEHKFPDGMRDQFVHETWDLLFNPLV